MTTALEFINEGIDEKYHARENQIVFVEENDGRITMVVPRFRMIFTKEQCLELSKLLEQYGAKK